MEEVMKLFNVLNATVVAAAMVGVFYSLGLKLHWAWQGDGTANGPAAARIGSIACYAVCVLVLVVALAIMVLS